MKSNAPISVKVLGEKRMELWKDSGKTLMHAEISFLKLHCIKENAGYTGAARINRYYLHMNRQIIRYCKKRLLPHVIKAYKSAVERGEAFTETRVFAKSRLTYNENGILSIYTDISENSEFGSITIRFGDVWNLNTGCPVSLSAFFPYAKNYKKKIKDYVISEVSRLRHRELGSYFDRVKRNCRRYFTSDNFYLTDEGLVVFYQMYTIGPRSVGVPSFTLKWSEKGPCKPE